MKKLMIILGLFLSFAASAKPLVYNHVDFKYTPFVYSVCEELGIENQTIGVIESPNGMAGFIKQTEYGFVIYIDSNRMDRFEIIAHELYHVYQHLNGEWDINNPTTLNGRHVSKDARQVEKDARINGKILSKRWR